MIEYVYMNMSIIYDTPVCVCVYVRVCECECMCVYVCMCDSAYTYVCVLMCEWVCGHSELEIRIRNWSAIH